jgi:predicted RNA-binding Zn ribbon-like protein
VPPPHVVPPVPQMPPQQQHDQWPAQQPVRHSAPQAGPQRDAAAQQAAAQQNAAATMELEKATLVAMVSSKLQAPPYPCEQPLYPKSPPLKQAAGILLSPGNLQP